MKRTISILIILINGLCLTSCKKKSAAPDAPPNNSPSTYQGGVFELFRSQYFDGTNVINSIDNINLTFINYTNSPGSSTEVNAGNVNFNGKGLRFDGYSYEDTTYTINYTAPTFSLNVSGSSQIDAVTTTFNPSYPIFTGDALLPTTVSKSTGFTINLGSSITNTTDTCTIQLYSSAIKKVAPGQTSVTFTPADLSGVMVANGYYFELYLYHIQPLNINNKIFYLRNELQYTKYNINVIP
jgi:hypothetical protein